MRRLLPLLLLSALAARAQDAPSGLQWHGSLWALGAVADRSPADGSLFLRPMDTGEGAFTLDGVQLGVDLGLGRGWALKATLLGGRTGELLQAFSGEQGSMGLSEAMLVWTGGRETLRLGRMWTWMGMESTDLTAAIPASHGLLATFPLPFGQLGLEWRHAFSPSWSTGLWIHGGEDRNRDNNRGKTAGLGVFYNHGGAPDRFMALSIASGPEQDGLGDKARTGAEGRKRERISHNGQWVWGAETLVWEAEGLRERFPAAAVAGARGPLTGTLQGLGFVWKHLWSPAWSHYLRAEVIRDSLGFRLNFDPALARTYGMVAGAGLRAHSLSLGGERRWGSAFCRLELRRDRLNREVWTQEGEAFRAAHSLTLCLGASFGP